MTPRLSQRLGTEETITALPWSARPTMSDDGASIWLRPRCSSISM